MSKVIADTIEHSTAGSLTTDYVVNGSAKAWANLDGTGTIALRDSFNIASVTDGGTGKYTTNFTNVMANSNYSPSLTGGDLAIVGRSTGGFSNATRLSNSFLFRTLNASQSAATDCDTAYVAINGDLA